MSLLLISNMQIPYLTEAIIQLIINLILILAILFTLYLVISLIIKVRKGKEVDKRKTIKKVLIYTIVIGLLILSTNLFSVYDPFDIITDPKGQTIILESNK